MWISKESIFTGFINFNVYTVKDVQYNEYFDFSNGEVREILGYYGFSEKYDAAAIEKGFTAYLRRTISIRDTNSKKEMKENFYHGIMLGLFAGMDGWKVRSNVESGEGYSDISVEEE